MPNVRTDETIAAIATPHGEGGISVIRVSGPAAFSITESVFHHPRRQKLSDFPSHTIHPGKIMEGDAVIDQVLVSIFKAPHSYTGEDVVEISSHGGMHVTKKILDLLIFKGARHAEPGEFTKAAFLNGKIDLMQAEAVLDLIKARSEGAAEIASRQLAGSLSKKLKELKDDLMKIYAHMEAYLDFPEEHLEVYSNPEFEKNLTHVMSEINRLIASFRRGALLREGASVVIVGKPNVGKSSLFNALLERDRALVSEFPGTTRDTLQEAIEIGGIYIQLTDTAGLVRGENSHPLDQMGMEKTRLAMEAAQLYLFVVDSTTPLDQEDREAFNAMRKTKPFIVVVNKSDLGVQLAASDLEAFTRKKDFILISSKTREGFDPLEKNIADNLIGGAIEKESEQITRLRHKNALEKASEALGRAQIAFREQRSLEFVALDLKAALDELRELVGEIYSEDLLDVIFSEFCIGK